MLLHFRETVEAIAKERGVYISENTHFMLGKLEDNSKDIKEAIAAIKKIEGGYKFKSEDESRIKKAVTTT